MNAWKTSLAAVAVAIAAAVAGVPAALAADQVAMADRSLKGDQVCTECHDENDRNPTLTMYKTKHGVKVDGRTPGCQSCHGPSERHVKEGPKKGEQGAKRGPVDIVFGKKSSTSAQEQSQVCSSCHEGGSRMSWASSTHSTRDVTCSNCHKVHNNGHDKVRDKTEQTEVCYTCHKEQRAQMNRVSHHPVPEGKMACSSCHNVHGNNAKQLVKSSTNDTCFTCHMEKRGPFVHNHQPVSEDCGICHQPHGTNTPNLLVQRPPMLCTGCHGPSSHPSQPPALLQGASNLTANTNARAGFGTMARGCLNCHTNIHGGNSTQNNATAGRFRR